MSSFGRVSKNLIKYRMRLVTILLILHIFVIVAAQIYDFIFHNSDITSFTGGVVIIMIVGIILLAIAIENTYSSDKYRLIPISDTQLYFSNMMTALISLIYLIIGELIIYSVAVKIFPNPYDDFMISHFNSVQQYFFKFEILVTFILGVLLIWAGISLLHLVIDWIDGFLPFKNQSIGKIILEVIVVGILAVPFKIITENIFDILTTGNAGNTFTDEIHLLSMGIVIVIVWILVFVSTNLYIMNRWSETTK